MDKTDILQKYLPAEAAPVIARWIDYFQCEFKVSRNRNSKYGDYRPPVGKSPHRISVNYDLNPYAFLVTTVHEFAHLLTWNEYKNKAKPHGAEWKSNFRRMMQTFYEKQIFPADVQQAITRYLENPAASSCSDLNLMRTLQRYDKQAEDKTKVEKIPFNHLFEYKKGLIFRKGELLKKRFRCVELKTGRIYLFNPLAEVKAVNTSS